MEVVNELRETIPVFVKAMEDAALNSRRISELEQDLMVEKAKMTVFIADNDALAVSNKRLLDLVNKQTEVVVSTKALRQRVLEKDVQEKLLKQTISSLETVSRLPGCVPSPSYDYQKCDNLEADAIELKKSCQIDLDKKEIELSKAQSMLHVVREEKKEVKDKLQVLQENMSQINVDVEKRIADIKQRVCSVSIQKAWKDAL